MERHVLLTIGNETSLPVPLRFLQHFMARHEQIRVTLFYVAPGVLASADSYYSMPESDHETAAEAACRRKGEEVLGRAERWMREVGGWPKDKIESKLCAKGKAKVRAIIDEAREGLYDAVLLGRRGLSRMEELFAQSVTRDILWETFDFPIWICRGEQETPRREVLVCLDGGEEALRIADHVGFMLAGEEHPVTLFHAGNGDKTERERIVEEAASQLRLNGVDETRIRVRLGASGEPGRTILAEARRGDYGAVAVGRRPGQPGGLSRLFKGSVCESLIHGLDDRALWISR